LLTDAVELERDRLVLVPCLVPADTQLDDDDIGALEGRASVAGQPERSLPADPTQLPPRERADDLQALRVDVEQDQLIDRQTVATGDESLDELWGVGASTADDCHLHTHDVGIVHSAT